MESVEFSCKRGGHQEHHPARKALHRRVQHGSSGLVAVLRIKRTPGPRQRGDHQDSRTAQIDPLRTSQVRWTDQQHQSPKSKQESECDPGNRPDSARAEPIEYHQPQRYRGNQKRRNPRRHGLLRPTHPAIPDEQQHETGDRRRPPVCPRRANPSLPPEDRVQHKSGCHVANPRQDEWRKRFDSHTNRQISGTPNHIYGSKSQ